MNDKEGNKNKEVEDVNKIEKTKDTTKEAKNKQDNNNKTNKNNLLTDKKEKVKNQKGFKINKTSIDKIIKENKPKLKEYIQSKEYKIASYIFVFLLGGVLLGGMMSSYAKTPTMTDEEVQALVSENTSYKSELDKANTKLSEANSEIDKLNEKIESAKPWFEMEENEQKEIEKANEEKRIAEEEEAKRKEEEEQKAREEEEKKGYNTGITYSQLARTPDDYIGKKVKFSGKVLQVMEGSGTVQIRLAVGGNYNNVILCEYLSSTVSSRVLEDDYITVYGNSAGLITYTSTMGGEITIPSMLVTKIDQ